MPIGEIEPREEEGDVAEERVELARLLERDLWEGSWRH